MRRLRCQEVLLMVPGLWHEDFQDYRFWYFALCILQYFTIFQMCSVAS